ncbi:G-type lectin S-receptor-like serine/threonine-protein kinase [Camellia lanceoleosa]|uniref:G-type lectin S-receptor-like serine/threonine-protein kinase n=1 Tax=Camellia lanceoleosa TaxID=1840588 RepID=A0ACC0HAC9_9ERIC|nr:G-type lectin S-receptor-like serine/threonine-protein kinase [Camellia lanceoleosa]
MAEKRKTESREKQSDGCSIWSEDLFKVEQLKDDDPDRSDFYLKLSVSAFLSEDSRRKRWKWFILALAASMTLLTSTMFYYSIHDSNNKKRLVKILLLSATLGILTLGTVCGCIIMKVKAKRRGKLQLLLWSETNHQWDLLWSQPSQQCEVDAYCGAFSSCSQKALRFCQYLPGFEPLSIENWNAGDMSGGCARKAPLQCSNRSQANGKKDQFLWISKVRLPVNPVILQHRGASDCKSACLGNCSCSAYAYGSDGCSIWSEDLFNVEQLTNDDPHERDFYLKLADSELFRGKNNGIASIVLVAW